MRRIVPLIALLLSGVGDVRDGPGSHHPSDQTFSVRTKRRLAAEFGEGGWRVVCGDKAKGVAVQPIDVAEFDIGKPARFSVLVAPSSTSHSSTLPSGCLTLMRKCACGLTHLISVSTPSTDTSFDWSKLTGTE